MEKNDVIVIGSGIGGLISAGMLAAKGLKPLVIEAHARPGGYLTSFRRKGFLFDSAVDCISGVGRTGIIGRVLSLLDMENDIEFLRVEPVRRSVFPDFYIDVPNDIDQYMENLITLFPGEASGISGFFEMASRIYKDTIMHIDVLSEDRSDLTFISPDVLRMKKIAYRDVLKEYTKNPQLMAALSDRCPFIGLSPSNVSALQMIVLIMSYFEQGAYRPRGGFQTLSDVLTRGIEKAGGRVIFGADVKKIIHKDGQCRGVVCSGGEEHECRYLISNADYISTFSNLLGGEYISMAERLQRSPGVSNSFFIVYGAAKGEHKGPSSIGCFPSYDLSYYFNPESAFRHDNTVGITIASREDSGRSPDGRDTIVLHEMVHESGMNIDRSECAELLVEKAGKALPDVMGEIEIIDTAVPSTLQRYTGNHGGAAFGWKQVPGIFSFNGHGLKNFHIAGHWSEMGGGVLAAAYSGAKAAADILAKEGISACA